MSKILFVQTIFDKVFGTKLGNQEKLQNTG